MNEPTVSQLQRVRRYARRQFNRLAEPTLRQFPASYHNSHIAIEALELAAKRFSLGYGIEGFCNQSNGRDGVTYINVGDPYVLTVLFESNTERFSVGTYGRIIERAEEGTYN
jgi:hypothetical protein